jgi:hypothetical protein
MVDRLHVVNNSIQEPAEDAEEVWKQNQPTASAEWIPSATCAVAGLTTVSSTYASHIMSLRMRTATLQVPHASFEDAE